MMLLKPNRRALRYQCALFYDFFVHDFTSKVLAVSTLQDHDFPDFVREDPSKLLGLLQQSLRED
jgi:hypothetical protein